MPEIRRQRPFPPDAPTLATSIHVIIIAIHLAPLVVVRFIAIPRSAGHAGYRRAASHCRAIRLQGRHGWSTIQLLPPDSISGRRGLSTQINIRT